MTNFEFYANEIKSRGFNFAVDKSSGELFCCGQEGSCDKCVFCPDKKGLIDKRAKFVCSKINIVRWLYQKHKIKMNALEYGLLEYMLSEGYEWVSRDDDFTITFFTLKPIDKDGTWHSPEGEFDEPLSCVPLCEELFEFLREDELFEINELLGTCEVVNDAEYKKLEEEYSYLKEEYGELEEVCQDLKKENNTLKRDKTTLMKANATVLNFYREDCGKMDDIQKLNSKLVRSCKKANRDFFILAAAYVATLVLMICLFIR